MQSRHPADRPAGWLESLQKPKGSLGRQKRQLMIESSLLKARESAGVKLKQLTVEKSQSPKKPEGSPVGQQHQRTIESF
jgi:hypothetical protein